MRLLYVFGLGIFSYISANFSFCLDLPELIFWLLVERICELHMLQRWSETLRDIPKYSILKSSNQNLIHLLWSKVIVFFSLWTAHALASLMQKHTSLQLTVQIFTPCQSKKGQNPKISHFWWFLPSLTHFKCIKIKKNREVCFEPQRFTSMQNLRKLELWNWPWSSTLWGSSYYFHTLLVRSRNIFGPFQLWN